MEHNKLISLLVNVYYKYYSKKKKTHNNLIKVYFYDSLKTVIISWSH